MRNKIYLLFTMVTILVAISRLNAQDYELNGLFCRTYYKTENSTFLLASNETTGYLLSLSNDFALDTLSVFEANRKLNGFHDIHVNNNGKIFILFDKLQQLSINDLNIYSSETQAYNLICLSSEGRLLWEQLLVPEKSFGTRQFQFSSDTYGDIYLGVNSDCPITIGQHTLASKVGILGKGASILKFNEDGTILSTTDFSLAYKSSHLYETSSFKEDLLAITLNSSWKNKKLQKISDQSSMSEIFFETDSLQLINIIAEDETIYLLSWEGSILKLKNNKLSDFKTVNNKKPNDAEEQSGIDQKILLNNGEYLTYISYYNKRSEGKRWDDPGSLRGVYLHISNINKSDLSLINSDVKFIDEIKNWIDIISCKSDRLEIIIDGKYVSM